MAKGGGSNSSGAQSDQQGGIQGINQGGGRFFVPGSGGAQIGKPTLGSGTGTEFGVIQDPIAQIAERIGQLNARQGLIGYQPYLQGGAIRSAIESEMSPLERLFKMYEDKLRSEQEMQAFQLSQAKRSAKGGASDSGIETGFSGGDGFGGLPTGSGGNGPGSYRVMDPYADVRAAAKEAAKRYLNTRNPHLISSLRQ